MVFDPISKIIGKKSIIKDKYGRNREQQLWTKKLDEMHICDPNSDYATVCGKPMLGNNYADYFPDREKCKKCFK